MLIFVVSGEASRDLAAIEPDMGVRPESVFRQPFPESGIHPLEQLSYVKTLENVSKITPVLIHTYSPYLLEALARKSNDLPENSIRFFHFNGKELVEENALSLSFESLSKPFRIFADMDAKLIQDN